MAGFKAVIISKGAFAFCRGTVAGVLWLSIFLGSKELVLLDFIILALSALLRVGRAPLILLYTYTVDKVFPSAKVMVNEKSIRFSHEVGAAMSLLSLVLLYIGSVKAGWILVVLLAVLQTSAAFGFCSAAKLYDCIVSGGDCCSIGRAISKMRMKKNV